MSDSQNVQTRANEAPGAADRADEIAREIVYGRERLIAESDDDANLEGLIAAALRSYGDERVAKMATQWKKRLQEFAKSKTEAQDTTK